MEIVIQLAVFLENKPGTMARMCRALEKEKINILALTVSDTVDHAVVRMVVSDTHKAVHLLEVHNVLVVESEVLMIESDNRPGSLASIAERLAKAKINVEYAYMTSGYRTKKGLMIIRPGNVQKALKVLTRK